MKKGKMYIPKDEELRVEIIWLHHDVLVAGYGGKWKIMELIMSDKRCGKICGRI